MGQLIAEYAITALVIVGVSEVAKRSDRLGALIVSLPLVSIMVIIWLHVEKQGAPKIASHAYFTFWYVLPTLPMFLLVPWLLNRGVGFWASLGAGCVLTVVLFFALAFVMRRFGLTLLP